MQDTARRRKWAAVILPAAALTAYLPFAAAPASGAPTRPPGSGSASTAAAAAVDRHTTDPALVAREKRQEVLDTIAGEITEGLSETDRAKIPGFTEVEVDPDHNRLRLHWKGTPPQRVRRILTRLPAGVTAEVVPARYSKADLHLARNKLLHNRRPEQLNLASAAARIRITSIGPAVDGSGLTIGYDEDRGTGMRDMADPLVRTARTDRSREVKALTDRLTGLNTAVVYKPLSTDLASRQHDASPWTGGAALQIPSGGICSSSFGVKNAKGEYMLAAAYHCNGGNGQWRTWQGGDTIGWTDTSQLSPKDDALGIRLPSQRSRGYLYDGPSNRTDGYAKRVTGWGQNNVGDYVCTDGANSGVHCQVRISATDIGVTGENGVYRPVADLAFATEHTADGIAAVNGDSGGPVFAGVDNYTADEARGMITALDTTVTCPASESVLDSARRKPWCFRGAYYVPISQTLYDMHWTLVTQ